MSLRPALTIVPFVPNRRPGDEAIAPGLGCNEYVDYVDSARPDAGGQELWLLYTVAGIAEDVDARVELLRLALRPGW